MVCPSGLRSDRMEMILWIISGRGQVAWRLRGRREEEYNPVAEVQQGTEVTYKIFSFGYSACRDNNARANLQEVP